MVSISPDPVLAGFLLPPVTVFSALTRLCSQKSCLMLEPGSLELKALFSDSFVHCRPLSEFIQMT